MDPVGFYVNLLEITKSTTTKNNSFCGPGGRASTESTPHLVDPLDAPPPGPRIRSSERNCTEQKTILYLDVAEAPPQRQQLAQSTPWRPVQRVRVLTTQYTYKNNDSPTTSTQTFQLLGWAFQTPKVSFQPILVQNAYLIHLTLEIGKLFNAISTKSWI